MSAEAAAFAHAQAFLLKAHMALAQAATEAQIIAALVLCTDPQARLRLLYLDLDASGVPLRATVVASWRDGGSWDGDPLLRHPLTRDQCGLISLLEQARDPLYFVDDLAETEIDLTQPCFQNTRTLVALKLTGTAHIEQGSQWHSIILMTWPDLHPLTRVEKYTYASLVDALSAMVSNHRLRIEALENLKRLQKLDRLQTTFLHAMSHELRTPLASMITTTDALLAGASGDISAEVQNDLELVRQSGEQLLSLINGLLDMASIEVGKMLIFPEQTDIAPILREAVNTMKPLAAQQGLTLHLSPLPNLPVMEVDPIRIRQVLINLLSNAVKFTPTGSIQVQAEVNKTNVIISITDTGIGIDPQHHDLIFERFQRIDSITARLVGGTGLGLSIAKHLIEAHGGNIWLTSTPGSGSIFSFSLPLSRGHHETALH
jgi:signal transduction histidine kinase